MNASSGFEMPQGLHAAQADVVLVRMPYPSLEYPSLALGLLKAHLARAGITATVVYADLLFAEIIGWDAYRILNVGGREAMIGEWSFAGAAFPGHAPCFNDFLRMGAERARKLFSVGAPPPPLEDIIAAFSEIRRRASDFTRRLARDITQLQPKLVGCSSTFEQQVPSLALLRAIRDLAPGTVTMLGGANCEDEMGLATVREFPWVDLVFSGEADEVFADMCRMLIAQGRGFDPQALPEGALCRARALEICAQPAGQRHIPRRITTRLDDLPDPDFDDYFRTMARMPYARRMIPGLDLETSRGCWWGARNTCTFCGLNGCALRFRIKSPAGVLAEFERVTTRYRVRQFGLTDCIIDMRYWKTLFPELARRGAPYSMFFETKSNLTRRHVRMLAEAGAIWIQPGIEGLHDGILRLMNKGVTAMENLQTLKYAREYGIRLAWHLLVGFPGESDAWHMQTAAIMPRLYHLQPIQGVLRIRFDRFSAYQRDPRRYGLEIEPFPAYGAIYPLSPAALNEIAYYFRAVRNDGRHDAETAPSPGILALRRREREWNRAWHHPWPVLLCMQEKPGGIEIYDTRPCARRRRTLLTGLAADLYRLLDAATAESAILEQLQRQGHARGEITKVLDELDHDLLIIRMSGQALALAVPGANPALPNRHQMPCGSAPMAHAGRMTAGLTKKTGTVEDDQLH